MKLITQGKRIVLPLGGSEVRELHLGVSRLATMIFRDTEGGESQIVFEETITLIQGDHEQRLTAARPGAAFDPLSLQPLLALLGSRVADAWALQNGRLEIVFLKGWILRATPESGYEGWHYHYPRPGRPPGSDLQHPISLHGADGYLA